VRVPPTFLLTLSLPLCLFSSLFLLCVFNCFSFPPCFSRASLYLTIGVSLVRARALSLFLSLCFTLSFLFRVVLFRVLSCFLFFLSFQCALAADEDFVDTISTDGGGRNCLWYSKNVKKTPYICSSNDAKTMCPMTCRGKVLHFD